MLMSANKRIFINILATYCRSIYTLIIGFLCGRWTLQALGKVDYGLMGVVGGLAFFIKYFNGILSGSLSRYFALSVGETQKNHEKGLEAGRMWFTTAVAIQTIGPTVLIIAGYPIGVWAIRQYLTIPTDRVVDCIWVWRFVCLTCFLGMVTMPMNAMYKAHQYIAELTIYSFITTTLNACFLYYMVKHPGIWLVKFMFWECLLGILPNIIIAMRAFRIFPECKILPQYFFCWHNIKQLSNYAFWNAWGMLGGVLSNQGMTIVVNKFFGPAMNAGVAIGNTLSARCNTLASSLFGAFTPAITNAWGAGDRDLARQLAFRVCKIGTFMILVFSLPLSLEAKEVLRIWLKNPPEWAYEMLLFVMTVTIIDRMTEGHRICVNANGRVAKYQMFVGSSLILSLPIAIILCYSNVGVWSIGISLVICRCICSIGRVYFARNLVGMSVCYWLKKVCIPIVLLTILCLGIGFLPNFFFRQSFYRICTTTILVESVLLPCAWFLVLDTSEKMYIKTRIVAIFSKVRDNCHK